MISFGLAAIIAAAISAVGSATAAGVNYASTKSTNEANAKMQADANKQNQYNLEHAHQIEMEDLKAAGLNPILTATGGSGAPQTSMQAARMQAPQLDFSGIGSAMSSMLSTLMLSQVMDSKVEALKANTEAKIAASEISAASRKEVADKYIKARQVAAAARNAEAGKSLVSSAKGVGDLDAYARKLGLTPERFKKMIRYNWIKR